MSSWSQIKAGWSSGWQALQRESMRAYEAAIAADPTGYLGRVQAFAHELSLSRATLNRIRDKLPNPPTTAEQRAVHAKYQALETRYHELAAGLYADARPAQTEIGVAPIVVGVVVGGVVIGVAGIAWAIAAYEYVVNLREQTALAERELDARVEASREGRGLQASTLPPPPPSPTTAAKGIGFVLIGGLAIAAGAFVLPQLLKK
jgi:hypothetical protein